VATKEKKPLRFPIPPILVRLKEAIGNPKFQLFAFLSKLSFISLLAFYLTSCTQFYLYRNMVDLYDTSGVHRVEDFWFWGEFQLIPGVCSNTFLHSPEAWADGETTWPGTDENGDTWQASDKGATPYTVRELQEVYMLMHTEIHLQLIRSEATSGDSKNGIFREPSIEWGEDNDVVDKAAYGEEFESEREKFQWLSSEELGMDSATAFDAPLLQSERVYSVAGYTAFALPFFSDVFLNETCSDDSAAWCVKSAPEGFSTECLSDTACRKFLDQKGLLSEGATAEDTETLAVHWPPGQELPKLRRKGKYQCVRTSLNGIWVRQVCDPATADQQLEGVVKDHMLNDWLFGLKDHRYIDFQTRFVVAALQTYSANTGLESHARFAFEFPLSGGIIPSSLVLTGRTDADTNFNFTIFLSLTMAAFAVFFLYEVLCMWAERSDYFRNGWNYLSIVNFGLFLVTFLALKASYLSAPVESIGEDSAMVVKLVGFHERLEYFDDLEAATSYLALNLLFLYLQAIKVLLALVPKCRELIDVLSYCFYGLVSLLIVIMLTVTGFALMFWVLLGSTMPGFSTLYLSVRTMMRAALGDFDVASIDEYSPDGMNLMLFLFGVLTIQFILLSMFFSILGEAQAVIIERNRDKEFNDLFSAQGALLFQGMNSGLKRNISKTSFKGMLPKKNSEVKNVPEVAHDPDAELSSGAKQLFEGRTTEERVMMEGTAILIQTIWRGRKERKRYQDARQDLIALLRKELKLLNDLIEDRYLPDDVVPLSPGQGRDTASFQASHQSLLQTEKKTLARRTTTALVGGKKNTIGSLTPVAAVSEKPETPREGDDMEVQAIRLRKGDGPEGNDATRDAVATIEKADDVRDTEGA
jgi:hypothetical protein